MWKNREECYMSDTKEMFNVRFKEDGRYYPAS